MAQLEQDPLAAIQAWQQSGIPAALATVVDTWGSSPRPNGSLMAINNQGQMVGSVSGGCVENAVVEEALMVINTREPKLLNYGISNEMAWEVGLACGGKLEVYVEPLDG